MHPTLENNKISDEHLLQIVSEGVVNDSERHEKLSKEKKETKVNEIDNADSPLLNEIFRTVLHMVLLSIKSLFGLTLIKKN